MSKQNEKITPEADFSESQAQAQVKSIISANERHLSSGPSELPVGMYDSDTGRWYRGFELKKLDSSILTSVEDQANPFKTFGNILANGLGRIFDTESGEDLANWKSKSSKIFFQDAFFLVVESFILAKGTTKIATAYRCPRPECGKFTKFENDEGAGFNADSGFDLNVDEDSFSSFDKEDMRNLPFKPIRDLAKPEMEFEMSTPIIIEGNELTKFTFRIPEIGDYILRGGAGKTSAQVEKEVMLRCLVAINGERGVTLDKAKSRYGLELIRFALDDHAKVVAKLNSIGYDYTNYKTKCAHCGYEYRTKFDLTNFFASALGQKS